MQADALKWQPVTTKACGMAFTSFFQLSSSPWSSTKHLNPSLHACISVSVRHVQNKPKLLGLNRAIYTWKWAWQLSGNICSANTWRSSQGGVFVVEQVQRVVCCGGGRETSGKTVARRKKKKKGSGTIFFFSNHGFCSTSVLSALFLYYHTGWEDFTFWVWLQSVSSTASHCVTFLF